MIYPIVKYGDPVLEKPAEPVTAFDDELKKLVEDMFESMYAAHGVGLAAPQVGKNLRLFVMNPSGEAGDDQVYINPVLSDADGDDEAEEGCLSLPDIHVKVVRNKKMKIAAQDLEGNAFTETGSGFITRVWQHEFDHLNGILLTDRLGPVAKMQNRKKLKELEDKYNGKR